MLDFDVYLEDEPADDSGLVLADRYALRCLLGSGATALVYEGLDLKTERVVAVKILIPAVREKVGGFFAQEARLAARVRSPHLIHASDFGEDQDRLYIVFDLLPGRPLAELTLTTLMPWSRICSVALHVLDALAALHRTGVVHRDVKPDNIFVSDTVGAALHATLLDLGFAFDLSRQGLTDVPEPVRTVFGTAGYIAPEILGGLTPDPRSDLYSLGAVLYVALTGQPVPDYRTFPQIVLPSPQVFRPEIPDAVAAVVLTALSDIEARFGTAEAMAAAITHAIRESEATSRPMLSLAPTPALTPAPALMPVPTPAPVLTPAPAPALTPTPDVVAPAAPTPEPTPGTVLTHQHPAAPKPGRALLVVAALACGALALRPSWGPDAEAPASAASPDPTPTAAVVPGPEPAPTSVAEATSGSLPTASEALEDARDSLHACASKAQAPFTIAVECDSKGSRFSTIDVVGDPATRTCARDVLDALRFEPGTAKKLTQKYRP